jgi:CrcB protein
MDKWHLFFVFAGGGAGSVLRYFLSWALPWQEGFPWATFWANAISCVLIGIMLAVLPYTNEHTRLLLMTGFCGGLSTFSTFSKETLQLLEKGHWGIAALYVSASVITGLLAVFAMYRLIHRA